MQTLTKWPKRDTKSMENYYGRLEVGTDGMITPRWIASHLEPVSVPYHLLGALTGEQVTSLPVHANIRSSLYRALCNLHQYFERDEVEIAKVGLNQIAAVFVNPPLLDEQGFISPHAWGAGIEFYLPLRKGKEEVVSQGIIDLFQAEGAQWGGKTKPGQFLWVS